MTRGLVIGVDVGGKRKGFDAAVVDGCRVLALRNRLSSCSRLANAPLGAADKVRYSAITMVRHEQADPTQAG